MKKIIIAACMALLGCGSVFAQQGKQAIGGNLSYGTEIESVGIGLKYQYNITDQIRIEPSMNYFFKNDGLSMFDINANIHYLFPIASNISLYPLAGFTYTNWHLDLGKAGDYDVSGSEGNLGEVFTITEASAGDASGIFVTRGSAGATLAERINNLALPPNNTALVESQMQLTRSQILLEGKVAAQPEWALIADDGISRTGGGWQGVTDGGK